MNRPPGNHRLPAQSARPGPPLHVITSPGTAAAVLRRLTHDGWHPREGFTAPEPGLAGQPDRLVCYGRVGDHDTARAAAHAAARGAGIVAVADPGTEPGRTLVTELRRLGTVHTTVAEPAAAQPAALIPEQRALLDRLADGNTIAAAAAAEFLSLRTANRRIAEARALLGVRTTREAVHAYLAQRDAL